MNKLTIAFLKIFFRNRRAIFFVLLLPVGIYLAAAFLGLEGIVRFQKPIAYEDFLLTGVIAFALMQTGVYTVTYTFIDYQRSQILKRLSVTPLRADQLLGAQVTARFVISLIQAMVLLGSGMILFGTKVSSMVVLLPVVLFVGSTLFLSIGFILASFARDYEQAAPYTTVIGTALMFIGDTFFPIENLPANLARVAEFLPPKPLVSMLRYSVLGIRSPLFIQEMVVLLAWFVVLAFIARTVFAKKAYK